MVIVVMVIVIMVIVVMVSVIVYGFCLTAVFLSQILSVSLPLLVS